MGIWRHGESDETRRSGQRIRFNGPKGGFCATAYMNVYVCTHECGDAYMNWNQEEGKVFRSERIIRFENELKNNYLIKQF